MSCTVRVSNLPANFDSSKLEDLFSVVGNVRSAVINGRSAMVEMSTPDEAQNCISYFNGQVTEQHTLMVGLSLKPQR